MGMLFWSYVENLLHRPLKGVFYITALARKRTTPSLGPFGGNAMIMLTVSVG
jgi:hypothetical protein